jgi:Fe-S-cluster containining protein
MELRKTELPMVVECRGCGVCCLHMGYPPFVRPVAPMSAAEIDSDKQLLAQIAVDPHRRQDLLRGRTGEKWWFLLPEAQRQELEEYIANYQPKNYEGNVETFDGPCYWFDMETRRCRHHEHRPKVCRDFETGSQQCHEWRNYYWDKIKTDT